MKTYRKMTLGDLIEALEALPKESMVRGFDPEIDSYRGYYERNALSPDPRYLHQAPVLARNLRNQIGKPTVGYKGGDYSVQAGEGVYLADYGYTGPCFAGLEEVEPGVYEPVLVDDGTIW